MPSKELVSQIEAPVAASLKNVTTSLTTETHPSLTFKPSPTSSLAQTLNPNLLKTTLHFEALYLTPPQLSAKSQSLSLSLLVSHRRSMYQWISIYCAIILSLSNLLPYQFCLFSFSFLLNQVLNIFLKLFMNVIQSCFLIHDIYKNKPSIKKHYPRKGRDPLELFVYL